MKKDVLAKLALIDDDSNLLITITTFDKERKGKELNSYVFSNDFPKREIDGTKDFICKLVDEQKYE